MNPRSLIEKITESARNYPDHAFSSSGKAYTCLNPYYYKLMRKEIGLYNQLDGIFVDGLFMCIMIRALWHVKIPRLSFDMSAMAKDLFEYLNQESCEKSIYLLGTRQKELEKCVANIRNHYPNIKIAGYRNGYFNSDSERQSAIREIINSKADFAVVGMGAPKQEKFVVDLRNAGYNGISFTCGGFLHQTSRGMNYYPEWVNRCNLRAIYRLFHERGMVKRLFNVIVLFPLLFIKDTIEAKKQTNKASIEAK